MQIQGIKDNLIDLGLHKSEVAVYLSLLQEGEATPPEIGRRTGIARTNCYAILKLLKEKQLVVGEEKGKRKAYAARDPQALLFALERKREIAHALVPDLRGLYAAQKNKPRIRFYEGMPGVRQAYEETLAASQICAIGSTKTLAAIDPDFYQSYVRQLQKHKVIFYDIQTLASRESGVPQAQEALGGLYSVRYLPASAKDCTTDMLLWGDNIATITLEKPLFATIVTSTVLARTYSMIFQTLWERL